MKSLVSSGKRKTAIARASIREGKGRIKVNNKPVDIIMPELARMKIKEPMLIAGELANKVDVDIIVRGGGMVSQAEAARLALARAILKYSKDKKLEKTFLEYDRQLLVADVRRRESRKPNTGGKARSKVQKSYR